MEDLLAPVVRNDRLIIGHAVEALVDGALGNAGRRRLCADPAQKAVESVPVMAAFGGVGRTGGERRHKAEEIRRFPLARRKTTEAQSLIAVLKR